MHLKKRTGFILLSALLVGIILLLTACSGEKQPTALRQPPATVEQYDLSVVKTLGNHSYIPLNIRGESKDYIDEILGVLYEFERAHPELEITGWRIEERHVSYGHGAYIDGLWVDHQSNK